MTSNWVKAQLCELGAGDSNEEVHDTQMEVQFNPTSLRVNISNKSAGGQQAGRQARQRPGTGEVQVSFDLVFDTADEGTTDAPVPVTRKTQMVERFVRPRGNTPALQTPPRVQFKWGSFLVQGVMESANTDLDLFAQDGTPLRAKVSVSIKGQDPSYSYNPVHSTSGGGAVGAGAQPPRPQDPPLGAPGTRGGGADPPAKLAQAMPGESLPQLAARNGLDPTAWRALAKDIDNPLSLPAGAEVPLPASLGGPTRNRPGADPDQVTSRLPLVDNAALPQTAAPAPAAAGSAPSDPVRSGQAVTQQGGVAGAIAKVRTEAQSNAVNASFSAFGMAAPGAVATSRPYGLGIPLRPLRGEPGDAAPVTRDPTVPGWQALPLRAGAAARAFDRTRPVDPCSCDCGSRALRTHEG